MYLNSHSTSIRFSLTSICGLLATFLILLVMKNLVGGNDNLILDTKKRIPLPEFVRIPQTDKDVLEPEVRKPEKVKEQPPTPDFVESLDSNPEVTIGLIADPGKSLLPKAVYSAPLLNAELIAIVDMQPNYPQRALSRDIEGYVIVEFTVSESGSTENIKVLEAYPENVFDRSALRAASKSRFKPRIVNGKEVAVSGMRKKYTFKLDD
ncbi:MAG: TonB family protein [Gammaproteobacteria bacterium]|nr:TonB family protein [Gammaproteobacteria bacterium]